MRGGYILYCVWKDTCIAQSGIKKSTLQDEVQCQNPYFGSFSFHLDVWSYKQNVGPESGNAYQSTLTRGKYITTTSSDSTTWVMLSKFLYWMNNTLILAHKTWKYTRFLPNFRVFCGTASARNDIFTEFGIRYRRNKTLFPLLAVSICQSVREVIQYIAYLCFSKTDSRILSRHVFSRWTICYAVVYLKR